MNSLPLILARLTMSGLAIMSLLVLWFLIKRSRRHSILLPVEVDGKEGVKGLTDNLSLGGCRMNGNLAVKRGQHLTLRLRLPGQESPIIIYFLYSSFKKYSILS